MAFDFNTLALTDSLGFLSTTFPATAVLELRSGAAPGVANAAAGVVLATYTLTAGWAAAATAARALAGVPLSVAAAATGTAGHFRLRNAADTARIEGSAAVSVIVATNLATAANGNVLNFASTTGISAGMNISGVGIIAGSAVIAVTATTVTMSFSSTAGVANAASITFAADLAIDNISITSGQTVNVTALTVNAADNQA